MERITIKANDETNIDAVLYNEIKEPTKGIVIVSHGFGEYPGFYDEFGKQFENKNYACIIFSQRGFGRIAKEQKKQGVVSSYQVFLDDIDAVVKYAKEEIPNTPLILYGHSMGGNIAVNYILRRNSEFSLLVLEAPWLALYKNMNRFEIGFIKAFSKIVPAFEIPKIITGMPLPLDKITSIKETQDRIKNDPHYHCRMTWGLVAGMSDGCAYALNNASALSIPTFLALAEEEEIVCNKAIESFYEKRRNRIKKRMFKLKHSIHNDRKKEEFYQEVVDFLDKNQ